MKSNRFLLFGLCLIAIVSLSVGYQFWQAQEPESNWAFVLVDAQGESHQLDLRQGIWYYARTQSPFYYFEYMGEEERVMGWGEFSWSSFFYDQGMIESGKYIGLPTYFEEKDTTLTLDQLAGDSFDPSQLDCSLVQHTWFDRADERYLNRYPDFFSCRVYYPDPTLEALQVLGKGKQATVSGMTEISEGELVLGDEIWVGEWKIIPTYFEYGGKEMVAYWPFGSCNISLWDGKNYFEVTPQDWYPSQSEYKETYYHLDLSQGLDRYQVDQISAPDCLPLGFKLVDIDFDPDLTVGS